MKKWFFMELTNADATHMIEFANEHLLLPGEFMLIREDFGDYTRGIIPSIRFAYYAEHELKYTR